MMTLMKAAVLSIVLLFSVGANAQSAPSAPWYKWKSKANGQIVCSQSAPGDNWERDSGPYTDSHCDTPVKK